MAKNQSLTNEKIARLFQDNFQMACYAIAEARSKIFAGKEITMTELLEEIRKKHKFSAE